jgi:hypothetical protein
LRLWWWRKVRKAKIPADERDFFERLGETVIQLAITSGLTPRSESLRGIYGKADTLKHAEEWLTERGDLREQHEQRLETVEWAILIFVVFGVIADFKLAGWLPW